MVVSNIFYFHPYLGKIPILTNIKYFSKGLKPPTSLVGIYVISTSRGQFFCFIGRLDFQGKDLNSRPY